MTDDELHREVAFLMATPPDVAMMSDIRGLTGELRRVAVESAVQHYGATATEVIELVKRERGG